MQIAHLFDDTVLEKVEHKDNYSAYIDQCCSNYNDYKAKQELIFCGVDLSRKGIVYCCHSSSKYFVCHLNISFSSKSFDAGVAVIRSGFSKIHALNITIIYSSVKGACKILLYKILLYWR